MNAVPAVATFHLDAPAALVVSVPHGGTHVPASCTEGLRVPPEQLWSDWRTAELFDLTAELVVPTVVARLSRFVADPNRAPVEPLHGDFWSTAVPARDPVGAPLYDRPLSNEELQYRLELAHVPFHRALDGAVTAALRRHPRVLLLDLHSFGLPLGVDVVLGDGNGSTAGAAAGDRVEPLQVALDQRRYLEVSDVEGNRPRPRPHPAGWVTTRRALAAVLRSLVHGDS